MFPVLLTIGDLTVSSFGVFLAIGFLLGIFLVWRLGRAWDLDEEKILDLTLLTFLGGLIGARLYFAIEYWQLFLPSPVNLLLINKVPGFSFWGGFVSGWLSLFYFARRFKLDFWQVADIASVGVLAGLLLSDLGCFFGGCNLGVPSKAFFAVPMVGVIGKRWPVQIIEAVLLALSLKNIWYKATHFHQRGAVAAFSFIYIGSINLILQPLKVDRSGFIFSLCFILLGLIIYYKATKENPLNDLKRLGTFSVNLFRNPEVSKRILQSFYKSCYNHKTAFFWSLRNIGRTLKKFLRRSNVKFS